MIEFILGGAYSLLLAVCGHLDDKGEDGKVSLASVSPHSGVPPCKEPDGSGKRHQFIECSERKDD